MMTNPTLLLRIQHAEPRPRELAWQEFRARYGPIIAGFARKLGAKPQDMDDVIQDVMLGFFAKAPTFVYDPAKGRFRGYLKVCTLHALQRRSGRDAKVRAMPLGDIDPEALEQDGGLDAAWNDAWEQQLFRQAMEAVREQYDDNKTFRAFEQHVILGKTVEEVSAALDCTADSVYQAKRRITLALREKVRELTEEQG
jgi:RNA polymerase sigma factor (sigma-70 family)